MNTLHISLGHNASAMYAVDGVPVRAYEQERLDRKKSSSAYPKDAIELAVGRDENVGKVYVSHWFDHYDLTDSKYLDVRHLYNQGFEVEGLSPSFTHHDAHANGAWSFFGRPSGETYVVVMDGFGNQQECFSVYAANRDGLKKIHRTYGYEHSLGLLYQYATSFMGLKENQDEYKLLGYESSVTLRNSKDMLQRIESRLVKDAIEFAEGMLDSRYESQPREGHLINLDRLREAKQMHQSRCAMWASWFNDSAMDFDSVRPRVAWCMQSFIEYATLQLMMRVVPKGAKTVIFTGGCFYNVKLNRLLNTSTQAKCLFHPLAGDQGAAWGMGNVNAPHALTLGERKIDGMAPRWDGVFVCDESHWVAKAAEHLRAGQIVNVVRGGMEYGPRALCHTTTFAPPTKAMVSRINALNERDEAMPMAPVMTLDAATRLLNFDEVEKMGESCRYMIATAAFREKPGEELMGVAHKDPVEDLWTARPQVATDPHVLELLRMQPNETLINTSYNYHGEPIVFSQHDAVKTHCMQAFRAKTLSGLEPPVTILVTP